MLDAIPPEVRRLAQHLPRFPDGRIDYTPAPEAVVIDCYVIHGDKLLILKRATPLAGCTTPWHVVSGYLDQECTLRQKALEELFEETDLTEVASLHAAPPYHQVDVRTWTVYPIAIRLTHPRPIRLNEEHTEYRWISPARAAEYLAPKVAAALQTMTR